MPSLKDIRKRISSVNNTKKITRAMKLVSTAKLKRAQDAMGALKPYAGKYREMLGSLVGQLGGDAAHPLLEQRAEVRRIAVFVLTSDRGMCGGFNGQIQKALIRLRRERLTRRRTAGHAGAHVSHRARRRYARASRRSLRRWPARGCSTAAR